MMIPSHLLKIEKTTSTKLNLILLGVCSLAIIIASPLPISNIKTTYNVLPKKKRTRNLGS